MFNHSVFLIQEEDEVPDDETLNQMIARREEEFDLFMVMLQESWGTTAFLIPNPPFSGVQYACSLHTRKSLGTEAYAFLLIHSLQTGWI